MFIAKEISKSDIQILSYLSAVAWDQSEVEIKNYIWLSYKYPPCPKRDKLNYVTCRQMPIRGLSQTHLIEHLFGTRWESKSSLDQKNFWQIYYESLSLSVFLPFSVSLSPGWCIFVGILMGYMVSELIQMEFSSFLLLFYLCIPLQKIPMYINFLCSAE